MAAPYNHRAIEAKWRTNWEKKPVNVNDGKKPKYYCLDMFPYPSGNGLHVGHWRGYVISDVWSRYKMLQGYYLIHPMGWDAFGLPAENYAIKMGVHPAVSTAANIKNIKRQINDIAAIYDWDMEVNTTDPEFYKWTQWIFVKMFKEGLAYEKEFPINWCPSCKTGLANEEVVNGCCERCGTPVTKKNLRQWMLRITKYADRLLSDLDKLDWPEKVKKMQTDWIGKSYGAEVDFPVEGREEKITVYTTRPDTLHGATFMVLAPEHALAKSLATDETREAVEKYIFDASMKSNVDRLQDKEKTGVFTGTYAINPLNGEKLPIWLSDYVLADYGTGAIMCVPAHDDRDFEFAKKFDIPIIQVIAKDGKEITIGYSQLGAESEWRTAQTESIKQAAKDAGINLQFSDAQQKQENQIKAIRSFIAQGVDLIAFTPIVETGWDTVLQEAKDAGIPVVIVDRDAKVSEDLYVAKIGTDSKAEGKKAFEWIDQYMKAQNKTPRDGGSVYNIAVLEGTVGSSVAIGRSEGFEEAMKASPDASKYQILMSQTGEFTRQKGQEVMESFLKSGGRDKIDILFSQNDDMALGAIQAIEAAGLQPGKDIVIVSVDGVKGAFQAMIEGKSNCTVECNPLQGPLLMETAKKILNGEQVDKMVYMEEGVFPADVAEKTLPERKY